MALSYGFFNSLDGDRKYDAKQMAQIFDGILNDGVFQSIGEYFATKPGTGLQVRTGLVQQHLDAERRGHPPVSGDSGRDAGAV